MNSKLEDPLTPLNQCPQCPNHPNALVSLKSYQYLHNPINLQLMKSEIYGKLTCTLSYEHFNEGNCINCNSSE